MKVEEFIKTALKPMIETQNEHITANQTAQEGIILGYIALYSDFAKTESGSINIKLLKDMLKGRITVMKKNSEDVEVDGLTDMFSPASI